MITSTDTWEKERRCFVRKLRLFTRLFDLVANGRLIFRPEYTYFHVKQTDL